MNRDRYDRLIAYYAGRSDLDPVLIKAQLRAESGMDPAAVSHVGAEGLAQFMPATWREWWDATPGIQGEPEVPATDAEAAVRAQCSYMRWLLAQVEDMKPNTDRYDFALAAYNWGIGNVLRRLPEWGALWRDHLPEETHGYLERIHRFAREERAREEITWPSHRVGPS